MRLFASSPRHRESESSFRTGCRKSARRPLSFVHTAPDSVSRLRLVAVVVVGGRGGAIRMVMGVLNKGRSSALSSLHRLPVVPADPG